MFKKLIIINVILFVFSAKAEMSKTCLLRVLQQVQTSLPPLKPIYKGISQKQVQGIRQHFSSENINFSMAHKESLREIIVQENLQGKTFRFKNFFETGTTNAASQMAPRANVENFRLGISPNEYKKVPHQELPKYGYMQFKKPLVKGQEHNLHLPQYGEDIWLFKTNEVKDKLTFTIGDSFSYKGIKAQVMNQNEFNYEGGKFKRPMDKRTQEVITDPHKTFLKYNEKSKEVLVQHYVDQINVKGYQELPLLQRRSSAKPNYRWKNKFSNNTDPLTQYNYFEVQYFDPDLNLEKVSEFVFTKTAPSRELFQILKEKKIKVLDWRNKKKNPIEYNPALIQKTSLQIKRESDFNLLLEKVDQFFFIRNPTPEQLEVLKKAYNYGLPEKQLASKFDFTQQQLTQKQKILKDGGFSSGKIPFLMDFFLNIN